MNATIKLEPEEISEILPIIKKALKRQVPTLIEPIDIYEATIKL